MNDDLYTARYALLTGAPVPEGPPLEALLDVLRPRLGPEPDWFEGALTEEGGQLVGVPEREDQINAENGDPIVNVPWLVGLDERFPMVGHGFTVEEFQRYLAGIDDNHMEWTPKGVTNHHAAAPSLTQRPNGFTTQHMWNLRHYYMNTRRWSRGPHLFVDDHKIWVHSPLTRKSIHAVSFNSTHISSEMLGDYDWKDDPWSGRGLKVLKNTAWAIAMLNRRFGFTAASMNTHRDDPETNKTCMGRKIKTEDFRRLVSERMKELD